MVLTIVDARHSIVSVAKQVQINQNALGMQFSDSDMEKVIVGVANRRLLSFNVCSRIRCRAVHGPKAVTRRMAAPRSMSVG